MKLVFVLSLFLPAVPLLAADRPEVRPDMLFASILFAFGIWLTGKKSRQAR